MMTLMDGFDKVSQIEEKMLSEITHFAQYDDIPYVADFKCPECGESIYFDLSVDPEDVICPSCGKHVSFVCDGDCEGCGGCDEDEED